MMQSKIETCTIEEQEESPKPWDQDPPLSRQLISLYNNEGNIENTKYYLVKIDTGASTGTRSEKIEIPKEIYDFLDVLPTSYLVANHEPNPR